MVHNSKGYWRLLKALYHVLPSYLIHSSFIFHVFLFLLLSWLIFYGHSLAHYCLYCMKGTFVFLFLFQSWLIFYSHSLARCILLYEVLLLHLQSFINIIGSSLLYYNISQSAENHEKNDNVNQCQCPTSIVADDVLNSQCNVNEKFYRRNPSGTFRDVDWYHLDDPKKVPGQVLLWRAFSTVYISFVNGELLSQWLLSPLNDAWFPGLQLYKK